MKSSYSARYKDSYDFSTKHSIPWLESQGFKILSNEENQDSILDRKYGIDYTAISPSCDKVAIMMRNMTFKEGYGGYNFCFRETCLKTNNLREYYRLSSFYKDWKNSKMYKEYGITDYIAVQTYCDRVNDIMVPRAYAWTSYKNILEVIGQGLFNRYTVGRDKPAVMLSVLWKDLRKNKLAINMEIHKPQRIKYSLENGFFILPSC